MSGQFIKKRRNGEGFNAGRREQGEGSREKGKAVHLSLGSGTVVPATC
jgi:hypothetical protein